MNELSLFEPEEKTMTTRELSETLNVSVDAVTRAANKVLDPSAVQRRVINGGESKVFNEKQASLIKQEIQKHHNLVSRQIDSVTTDYEMELMTQRVIEYHIQKANEYKVRAEVAESALKEQQPKVEVYDAICDSETLQDLQTVALTIKLKNIFKVLEADNVIETRYTTDGQKYYKPLARYSEYLVLKDGKAWTDEKGLKHIRPRVFVTGKGLTWLTRKYKDV